MIVVMARPAPSSSATASWRGSTSWGCASWGCALSNGARSLTPEHFAGLMGEAGALATSLGRPFAPRPQAVA